jgi:hypothetical protein
MMKDEENGDGKSVVINEILDLDGGFCVKI